MPKAEKGSLKDLGKRIKAKGLQKLRFWCEMCNKQCRDANGFKCHLTSESHLRQMKLFSEDAGGILKRKSAEFENNFLEHLRLRHANAMVNANNVYQQVIRDKQHVHMNATMWATLSDFVQYLGKKGKCVVEENERGWYVKYIPRHDASTLAQRQQQALRQEADKQAEQDYVERMERLRKEASHLAPVPEATKLESDAGGIKVALPSVVAKEKQKKKKSDNASAKPSVFGSDDEDEDDGEGTPSSGLPVPLVPPAVPLPSARSGDSRKRERNEKAESKSKKQRPTKSSREDKTKDVPWLFPGIVVRIIHKKLEYFKEKAVVDELVDDYTAKVYLLDNDRVQLQLDQQHVETVVPKHAGERVRIVRGKYRGKKAAVEEIRKKDCRAVLRLKDPKKIIELDFDDFCRVE